MILKDILVSYPKDTILSGANLTVKPNERIALIGENGTGKSTLLKIASGLHEPTSGSVERPRDLVIGYLPQSGLVYQGTTLWEEMLSALPDWLEAKQKRKVLLDKISSLPSDDLEHQKCLDQYGELESQYQQSDGYAKESQLKRILAGLGFTLEDYDRAAEEFSAGWQMRIGLAKLLAQEPDLMLLDEPTDHLDLDAKNWLEDYLKASRTGFVLVSHDRHFIDVLAEKVIEIVNKKLEVYIGNYTKYLEEKEVRQESQNAAYATQQTNIQHLEDFVAKNRVRKAHARQAQSRLRQLDKIERIEQVRKGESIQFHIPAPSRAPKKLVELENVEKAFSDRLVFSGLALTLERNERVAVVGPNGAGKSTLLRIIAGQEKFQKGIRLVADGISIGWFSQDTGISLQGNESLLETLIDSAPQLTIEKARGLLARFRFRGDDVFKPVSALSGGERVRLALARILPKGHHLLLLDEPTNHLDIISRQALLEALQAYGGTLVFVSHDRYFIQEIATQILEIQGDGVKMFRGYYEEYLVAKEEQNQRLLNVSERHSGHSEKQGIGLKEDAKNARIRSREAQKALQRKEQKRLRQIAQLEDEISHAELKLKELEEEMSGPEAAENYSHLQQLHEKVAEIKQNLKEKYAKWEELSLEADD